MDEVSYLSNDEIEEYQRIYKKYYGKEISKQEVLEQGIRLVNFVKLLVEIEKQKK